MRVECIFRIIIRRTTVAALSRNVLYEGATKENSLPDLMHSLKDHRIECDSTLISLRVNDYLQLIEAAYEEKGGIEFQRSALKSKTAKTIRQRLVTDISKGAIIPPVVLGVLCSKKDQEGISAARTSQEVLNILQRLPSDDISIIDGMQRTTALREASDLNPEVLKQEVRVEVWSTQKIGSLIYRMLILNTGQVPWEIARQLETVYSQLVRVVRDHAPAGVEIYSKDDEKRRRSAGKYQASAIVRLFLAFSARRAEFDLKDRVAEDFARLDAIESSAHEEFVDYFIRTFILLVKLDFAFSRLDEVVDVGSVRISSGKDFFNNEPALTGFFVATAIHLFDAPGFNIDWSTTENKMSGAERTIDAVTGRLDKMSLAELAIFLQLETLNDRLNQRSGQVGRFEKDLFVRSFSTLLNRGDELQDMTPCWLS